MKYIISIPRFYASINKQNYDIKYLYTFFFIMIKKIQIIFNISDDFAETKLVL